MQWCASVVHFSSSTQLFRYGNYCHHWSLIHFWNWNSSIQITYLPLRKLIWDLELLLNLVAASGAIFISIYLLTISHEAYFEQDCEMPHHLASWIVLIVWTNLMLLVGRLPKFGCYSLMLTTVTKNFLKVNLVITSKKELKSNCPLCR